jgi:selenocysteine lyase/cysteine desulfurase
MTELSSQRHLFDIPDDVAWFNTAYYAAQLQESRERLHAGVDRKSHPWEQGVDDFFDDAERVRLLAERLFGGDRDGYAIVPSASYGLSTAARAIEPRLGVGDRIVLVHEAFPSNYLPWERVARERGASIVSVDATGGDWTEAVLGALDARVKIVSTPNVHWTNGARFDVARIAQACRELDALYAIDASQSLGAMPFSIDEVRPDFLVAVGYKWLLAPYGFGLMYVSPRWRNARPLEETWIGRSNAKDFAGLVTYCHEYRPGARRFDVGETCRATILPGAIAALEQIDAWTIPRIAASLERLNADIASRLEAIGFTLPDPTSRAPHMFGARVPEGYEGRLVPRLAERGVYVSQRGDSVRLSPYLHVTSHDVDRLMSALDELL